MKKFFSEKWFVIAVAAIGIALLINTLASFRNDQIITKNNELREQIATLKARTNSILYDIVHGIDLGVRGYALTKKDQLLDPFTSVKKNYKNIFNDIEKILKEQNYPLVKLNALRDEIEKYMKFSDEMAQMVREERMADFDAALKLDKGYDVWLKFADFRDPLFKYEDELNSKATANYDAAMRNNLIFQVVLILVALPVLALIVIRIQKERKGRESLLHDVAENDRKYVFNPGTKNTLTAKEIIAESIANTRKASHFVKNMANSNYNVEWDGLNESNKAMNMETLAGDLMNMREQLKKVKQEDEKRNWMNEGLATFSELVRNHQHDSQLLADKCVSFLTKYLNAQQASLFVLTGSDDDQYLELTSCYAFDKKKFIEKRIDIGTGLVGQAFLEGETMQLKQIPKGYTEITSGLGDATPNYLVIVPMKYDIQTVALIELASFKDFEKHHVTFLQKAGEFLASAILNSQNTQKMRSLLETARINEEQMRQREEEMRQNMEELQATQEELVRKEKEMQKRLSDSKFVSENNF
jgi:CHASE3 domain sensor protein/putative methionine-R-sulfoxide reductase with GAF domain